MKTVNYFLLISTITLLISCKKEIKFKGENAKSMLVLNGIIENDSIIRVAISKSTPAIGEQNTGSSDITSSATLVLTDNTTAETFSSNSINANGFYEFGTTAKTGHSYSISVSHPDYATISSSMTSPENIAITSWDTTHTTVQDYDGEVVNMKQISIKWQDPVGENKYTIKVFVVDTVSKYEALVSTHIYVDENDVTISGGQSTIFQDNSFNNTLKTLTFSFNSEYYKDLNNLNIGEKSYRVVLYNISNEVYNYITSTSKAEGNGNPFAEPVAIYSNIKNGIGIFGGVGTAVVNIK